MNNSEILYLYDAKLTNPNGDPDEENRPRMDYERDINLVSDLRIKRYIRDYLLDKGYELFVSKVDDKAVTAEGRIKELGSSDVDTILDKLIDVRLFGATIPVKNDNKNFIGPVQFNWGYSLNKVELQGAIGKDYRVKYSFIAFSGVISGKRAEHTKLKEEDVALLDEAMRYAIPELATRSKIGQYPRLYLRVEYNDDQTILGDLRDYLKFSSEDESVRDIKEVTLDITELVKFLNKNSDKISKLHYFADEKLKLVLDGNKVGFKEAFDGFSLNEVK